MWALDNPSPLAAGRTWTRDKHGAHVWIVVVKATWAVAQDGQLTLLDEQPEPTLVAEWNGKPGESSLRAEADLGGEKPTTDVLFVGDAHAPGAPVRTLPVSLRVGPVHKQLLVHGTRVFLPGGGLSAPAEMASRELVYEWAWGGGDPRRFDVRNPVGRGAVAVPGEAAHSIEYLDGDAAGRGPAGFGPIASHWQPRLAHAGTFDAAWQASRKPLLPLDHDPRFACCAPADQRPPNHLQGGEPVELVHLAPWAVWRFALPRIAVRLETWFGRRRVDHDARLSSVTIDGRARRLGLCWQGALRVAAPECDYLDRTSIVVRE